MAPVIAARVSLSPPMEMTLRMASSKDSLSMNASTAYGTVPSLIEAKWSKVYSGLTSSRQKSQS